MSNPSSDLSSISLQQRAVLELWLKKKRESSPRPAPILRRENNYPAPLSFAQQRLWFLDQLEPGSQFYNCAAALRLKGKLNVGALERAFGEIIRRHEILRTVFPQQQGKPAQVIMPEQPLNIPVSDITDWSEQRQEDEALRLADEEAQAAFDLGKGPLLRFRLLKLSEEHHVMLLLMHHIVADGWSTAIVVRELASLYEAFSTGKPSQLNELPIQYADFARWQHEWLQGEVLEKLLSYWKQRLSGAPKVIELPTDRPRQPVQSFRGAKESFVLSEELSEGLRELSKRETMSLFMTLLTAFQTLLSRYSGQDDIVVGSPFAVRDRAEIQEMIGFFANALVLRTDLSGDPVFRELLVKVREAVLEDYSHQDLPFERLVEELQPDRDMSRSPIFQTMFSLQNMPMPTVKLPGLILSVLRIDNRAAKFDLHLAIEDTKQLSGWLEYNTDLFDMATIKRMIGHFQTLLDSILSDPLLPLSLLPMLSPSERSQLLLDFNDTDSAFPRHLCIHHLFEAQVDRSPDSLALVFNDHKLSYSELNQRSNQLAHYLQKLDVGPESLVGICMERSVEMVVSLLGILKAGGAYLPIDPYYPLDRISFMIEDSSLNLLLTQQQLLSLLGQQPADMVCIDSISPLLDQQPSSNPTCEVESRNAAYLIYTSGSTGRPKAVVIEHKSVVNFLTSMEQKLAISSEDVLVAVTTLSFDIAGLEIYLPLKAGARVEIASREEGWDGEKLAERLAKSKATMMQATPASWRMLMESGWRAERGFKVLCGGEGLAGELARQLKGSEAEVWNLYGPTETTIWSGGYEVEEEERGIMPVGRPIANTQIYVLGDRGEMKGIGGRGEIYIGGEGVGRGYAGRADQTAERFVPDGYSKRKGARMYRTGDEGRMREDGKIEFVGRMDNQVKVRGYRIELGEIEEVLRGLEEVREAVVVVREDGRGEKELVCYVVEEREGIVSREELIERVSKRLPEYMVPKKYVVMKEMPLTGSGKVDRKALPEPDQSRPELEEGYIEPSTATEEILAGIWGEVLKVERVGIRDNFFGLGGHSLLATQLISRVRDAFQVEVPLRLLFEQPTVAGMAESIEAALRAGQGAQAPSIARVSRDSELPLSFAQQRLWILDQLEPGTPFYNISAAMHMTGRINVEALQRSLGDIFQRHEVLRTTFTIVDGRPEQVISAASPINIPVMDLSDVAERKAEAERIAGVEAQQPFDLTRGPLLRVKILRLSEDEHVLLFTLHHIAGDAWSMGVLGREFAALYGAYVDGMPSPLNPLPIQYVDFAYWQQHWLQGDILEEQLSYWRQQMAGAPPVLELPTDRPRPAVQRFRGAKQSFVLSADTSQALKSLSRQEGVTLFMMLLAGFQILLHRYTDQPDIVTGSPIAGRNRGETEELIGFFVNTLVLRTDLSGNPTFSELVERVREVCLGAYAHQDLPFEKLVEELQPKRDLSRAPLFQVMFGLINVPKTVAELRDLTLNIQQIDSKTAKFDLNLVLDDEEQLTGSLEYNTDLFDFSTISRMLGHFQNLLKGLTLNPEQRIASLPLLGESERKQVLEEWNDTTRDYPSTHCIHHLFEAQADRTPDAVAVVSRHHKLSYKVLNLRANKLAHFLIRLGTQPEALLGICLDRSLDMIVALLAILKAGAAYVPLDPRYPKDRLAWTISDANMQLLITQHSLLSSLPDHNAQLICLDTDWQDLALEAEDNPQTAVTADNLAYVIYTSGSTGRPKGVAIEHRNTVAMLEWAEEVYSKQQMGGVLASTSICFDLSVYEIFAPLMVGGSVILAENALDLMELEAASEVTLINTVPSAIVELMKVGGIGKSVRTVNLAGEALSRRVVDELYEIEGIERVYDLYGPTEDTTYTTYKLREAGGRATIGRGIRGEQIYILDKEREPVAIGVVGEIYISGRGVTRGYLNGAEATAERYIPNPLGGEAGERMYETGDVGRWRAEGEIEYLGRRDKQVKVRGYRIELGEIEEALRGLEGVREAVVEVKEDERGNKRLVGYVVGKGEQGVTTTQMQEYLRERLPEYMIPTRFVMLEEMPLTPNGKVDRRTLPAPDQARPELEGAYVAPRTPNEEMFSAIWAELLKIERVGIYDNFFRSGRTFPACHASYFASVPSLSCELASAQPL